MTGRIANLEDIDKGLTALARLDGRLAALLNQCGPIPLRLSEPDFPGLASIIVSQQVSKASAAAIFDRLSAAVSPLTATAYLDAGEDIWRQAGLSRPKQRTLAAISEAIVTGGLDLEGLCDLEPEAAIIQLTGVKGIGPWTAEVYLMFCAGHADIFPAGDLALQEAIKVGFGLADRPNEKLTRQMAQEWSPWRSVAARLLWDYYRVIRKEATPI